MNEVIMESSHPLAILDAMDVTMKGGSTLLNIVLALVMFGVALGIRPATFVDIIRNPKSILTGILCQIILLPALTLVLIIACGDLLSPMVALGMILVSCCPGGNISNFITSLSRGNAELSVSLTAFNTAVCIFTTPLNFAVWGRLYLNFAGKHAMNLPELQIPFWDIFQSIVIISKNRRMIGQQIGYSLRLFLIDIHNCADFQTIFKTFKTRYVVFCHTATTDKNKFMFHKKLLFCRLNPDFSLI